jgi:hypothetical protein
MVTLLFTKKRKNMNNAEVIEFIKGKVQWDPNAMDSVANMKEVLVQMVQAAPQQNNFSGGPTISGTYRDGRPIMRQMIDLPTGTTTFVGTGTENIPTGLNPNWAPPSPANGFVHEGTFDLNAMMPHVTDMQFVKSDGVPMSYENFKLFTNPTSAFSYSFINDTFDIAMDAGVPSYNGDAGYNNYMIIEFVPTQVWIDANL